MPNESGEQVKALSIRQPWAWLIINGNKSIENRDWRSSYAGPLAIHAAKGMTRAEYLDAVDFVYSFDPELAERIPKPDQLVRGAIIGTVLMSSCVAYSMSPWFRGRYGFVLLTPEPCDPVPINGALGLWDWNP